MSLFCLPGIHSSSCCLSGSLPQTGTLAWVSLAGPSKQQIYPKHVRLMTFFHL